MNSVLPIETSLQPHLLRPRSSHAEGDHARPWCDSPLDSSGSTVMLRVAATRWPGVRQPPSFGAYVQATPVKGWIMTKGSGLLRNKYSIVGIGETEFSRNSGRTT